MLRRYDPRFQEIGTRLVPTADGCLRCNLRGCKGVLVGFGRRPDLIRVRRDDIKTIYSYHYSFWRRAKTFVEQAPATPPTENPDGR